MLQLDRTRNYFFWLSVAYGACELVLSVLALLYYPPKSSLLLWSQHEEGYLVRPLNPTRQAWRSAARTQPET